MNYNRVNCMIVDDEPDAAALLDFTLNRLYGNVEITGIYHHWRDALNALRKQQPDILFLDISMPEKNGMDLLELLPEIRCEIIFTTAYAEFALDAFRFFAIGYLLKPITDKLLVLAFDKALTRVAEKRRTKEDINLPPQPFKLGVPNRKGIDYLNIQGILYLEAKNGYTCICTAEETLLSSHNLGSFKKLMEYNFFYLVHRSYLINLHHISRYVSEGFVIMSDKKEIPVSKNLREDFLARFLTVSKGRTEPEG